MLAATALAAAPARAASADIAALQVAMGALGLYPHPVDGISGPWTQGAVRRFQARNGIAVDGVAGPQTRRALGRRGMPDFGSRPMRVVSAGGTSPRSSSCSQPRLRPGRHRRRVRAGHGGRGARLPAARPD